MNVWEVAILKSIASFGSTASLQQIYERIHSFIKMTDNDLKETQWGGRPAYQHQIRSHISNLCQEGSLRRLSRGRYALTQQGKNRIERNSHRRLTV